MYQSSLKRLLWDSKLIGIILQLHFVSNDCITIRIEYTNVRNFAQGEEEWASHRDSATMDVA